MCSFRFEELSNPIPYMFLALRYGENRVRISCARAALVAQLP